jgi:hypothetical protein
MFSNRTNVVSVPAEKNLPCQHVTEASTYITVHYWNGIHASSRCMDSVQPQTPSVWMECIPASHIRHVECTRMAKRGDITTHDMFILNRACHPLYDSHTESTSIRHVSNQTRRWDRGIDHCINPRIPVMRRSTRIRHVASSSLVVQESKSDIR